MMTDPAHGVHLDATKTTPPAPPVGDDPTAASLVLDRALDHIVATLDDLRYVAAKHAEVAPVSSNHVENLIGLIALDTLAWIDKWPS